MVNRIARSRRAWSRTNLDGARRVRTVAVDLPSRSSDAERHPINGQSLGWSTECSARNGRGPTPSRREEAKPGDVGVPTSASANGAPFARTTAPMAMLGTTSRSLRRRSRAYRWGEDGIAGFADDDLRWCLSLALWNGAIPS